HAREVFEGHGAVVSIEGDAVVGAFGLPSAREDDSLRALRAASELSEDGFRLALDTGIALGSGDELTDARFVGRLMRLADGARAGDVLLGAGSRGVLAAAVELD